MQAVSASRTESLRTLCRSGGLPNASELTFRQPVVGRIHTTYVAAGMDNKFILQDINPRVIDDPAALARVTDLALASTGHDGTILSWPGQGRHLFHWNNGYWLRRRYIEGDSLRLPLNTQTLRAMGKAMRTLHAQISPADFSDSGFIGVNPWSDNAALSLSARWLDDSILPNAVERAVAQELAVMSSRLGNMRADTPEPSRLTVVHRDTKPSNFLRQTDNTLLLIDFDTLGLGDPVCDLGEATRALVVGDNDGKALDAQLPEPLEIIDAVQAMCDGYGGEYMQVKPVLLAALSCCLCQAQRFLDDHLAGDVYYSVKVHGESLEQTRRQLQAMRRLFECHAALN